MKEDFVVPINGLTQGRTEFHRCVGREFFANFESSEILDSDLQVDFAVEKSGHYIGVDGSINGTVTVVCDRCLEDLCLPVKTGFSLSIKFGAETTETEVAPEGDREIVYLPESEAELDLGQVVYDYVCLSLPLQRVHEEGGCNPEALKYLCKDEEVATEPILTQVPSSFATLKNLLETKK